jgi:hypothetical protein
MSDHDPVTHAPVKHRGRIARTAFVVLVLGPAASLAAAVLWFCLSRGWPFPIAGAVLAVLFLIVDHFAYGTFCQIEFTPEGLLYRGGGLFWRRVRKERVLSWADYIYILTAVPLVGAWSLLEVVPRAKCDTTQPGSEYGCWETLSLAPRAKADPEFDALARAILAHNPDARVKYWKRPRRSPGASTERVGNIDVSGDDEFRKRTAAALRLVEQRDPINYARLQKYIAQIVSVESKFYGSPIAVDYETAAVEVYRKSRLFRLTLRWYAWYITSMACSYILHHRFKFSAYSPERRQERSEVCFRAEVRSLRRLGGSQADIELLEKGLKKTVSKQREEDAVKPGDTAGE